MPEEADSDRRILDPPSKRAVQPLPPGVDTGARVLVRGRSWTVDACDARADCDELHLTSLGNDRTLTVLWPFDRPRPELVPPRLRVIRPRAWLAHARALAAEDRPIDHLLTRNGRDQGRIVLPYQLAPALAVAAGAARVLLADEVGLGKTAQAGWIVDHALAGRADARVLIAVPAGVRMQWTRELFRLFAIEAHSVDARWVLRTVNALPAGVSVWTPPGVYVISLDFLKRPDVAASTLAVTWDVLVVDEAHVAAAPTERHKAVDAIARRSRTVVLITATPFSGDEASFSSLVRIGAIDDPSPAVIFRRSRSDVGDLRQRRHRFVRVSLTSSEQRLQRLLDRYCREIWTQAPSPEGRLAAIVLRKRALSSSTALERSLRRRQRLLSTAAASAVQLDLFGGDTDDEDDEPAGVLGVPGLSDAGRERRWLDRLIAAAERAAASDSKLQYLKRLLRRAAGEPAVIFTEFRDTLADLADAFPDAARLHGGMTAAERDEIQARFNAEGGRLFATDAAAHGVNLHGRCRLIVNFELPWNPARLEQRIGRVDRIGQTKVVHAQTLVARDTAEDLVIANVARRLARIAKTLGPKDRLAAFLDDARIAGMAIGGDPIPGLDAAIDETPVAIPESARAEAERLEATIASRYSNAVAASDVAVSSMRATASLPPGFIAIVQWALREAAGRVAACRTFFVHFPGSPAKPSRAADAARIAAAVIATHGMSIVDRARIEVEPLRTMHLAAHERRVQRQIQREHEIACAGGGSHPLQPGLFDRRVIAAAASAAIARDEAREETSRRIAQLHASARLEERFDIRGLFILSASTA